MPYHGRAIRNGTLIGLVVALIVPASSAFGATISLERTIRTTPFAGTSVSMRDHEGSAFVPADNSLWLADDNRDAIVEVNPATGALKRRIRKPTSTRPPGSAVVRRPEPTAPRTSSPSPTT